MNYRTSSQAQNKTGLDLRVEHWLTHLVNRKELVKGILKHHWCLVAHSRQERSAGKACTLRSETEVLPGNRDIDCNDVSVNSAETVEGTYTTETEIHAPMEPHALVAHWENNDSVTFYEPTQWVKGSQRTYAELCGIPQERVRIISPYIGGGFGCKAFPWSHGVLGVAAAREIN